MLFSFGPASPPLYFTDTQRLTIFPFWRNTGLKPEAINRSKEIKFHLSFLTHFITDIFATLANFTKGNTNQPLPKETSASKTKVCNPPYTREKNLDQQLSSMIQKVSLRQDWAKWILNKLKREIYFEKKSEFMSEIKLWRSKTYVLNKSKMVGLNR